MGQRLAAEHADPSPRFLPSPMPLPLHNRIAIITGASAGIGLAIAESFVAAGASVVLNARRAEKLDEVRKALTPKLAPGAKIELVPGDAADEATITRMLDTARSAIGQGIREADLVVVNAGRGLNGSVITSETAEWEEMIRTNLLGAALLIRHAGKRLVAEVEREAANSKSWQDHARDIIVLGSTVGRHVSPFSSMYGGTKFAVHGMTEGVRREIGPKGVRVTLIEPAFVVSEFQGVAGYDPAWIKGVWDRIGPVLKPEDVARSVTFAASQPSSVHVSDILIRPTRQDYP